MYRMELADINNTTSKTEGRTGKWAVERVGCTKMDHNTGIRLADLTASLEMATSVSLYPRSLRDVTREYLGTSRVEDSVEESSRLI